MTNMDLKDMVYHGAIHWLDSGIFAINKNDIDLSISAVEGKQFECLKYLHKIGCKIYGSLNYTASIAGCIKCLEYSIEHGYNNTDLTIIHHNPTYLSTCVTRGDLNFIKYLIEKGYKFISTIINVAIRYNHYDCMRHLHKNGYTWSWDVCDIAIKFNRLECLKYIINFCVNLHIYIFHVLF